MEILRSLLELATELIPTAAAIILTFIVILAVRFVLNRSYGGTQGHQFRLQMIMLLLSFLGLLVVILSLPVSEGTIGQLLSLLGILLSAAIALSATTFVGNIMAGLMLRAVRNFRSGDFIRVGDHYGRVSDRGLFHIEIQTEDRDLTTLPNLYLVTNPVRVVRSSGTLVTAEVSLGYDLPWRTIIRELKAAALDAGLEEPFVYVVNLGDSAVTYRVAGLLTEVKSLLTTRSRLREAMLDRLHSAGIEIVSPTFMNQRPLTTEDKFIPPTVAAGPTIVSEDLPESLVFDKADEAESLENLHLRHQAILDEIKALKDQKAAAEEDSRREELDLQIEAQETRVARLAAYIARREKDGG
jgi:small-conductance mechanosensitive channel